MKNPINIVWLKRDIRLVDHEPLFSAALQGKVVLLYVVETDYWKLPDASRRHWHFIHDCLTDFQRDLSVIGCQLVIRVGDVVKVLEDFRTRFGQIVLWSHEETGNAWTYQRDNEVASWCASQNIKWHQTPSNGVVRRLKNRDAWSTARSARMAKPIVNRPPVIASVEDLFSDQLPAKDDPLFGANPIGEVQKGGRQEGVLTLNSFLKERGRNYMATISKPGVSARHCSRLSAHLAYGSLSVREVEQATHRKIITLFDNPDRDAVIFSKNLRAFLSRLAWRCHFVQKLEQQPEIETQCMHGAFEGMREPHFNEAHFNAWKNGTTGYPLVDASMRSLYENGWINFRMRAMLVSFASYQLWLDWRVTAPHLAQLFTDYEPGIHFSQFQMQSGVTGINAIRIYNPIKQSLDHDPEGKFIRRYVPELKDVSSQWIHEPWRRGEQPLHYPRPIVDHDAAIKHARFELGQRRRSDEFQDQSSAVHQKLGSRSKQPKRHQKVVKATSQLSFDL